jgi:hypothetical protein
VRESATAFIHTRDIHGPVAPQVARDLNVADEKTGVAHCYRGVPRGAAVSGVRGKESAASHVEVVPRNVQSPEERRARIIVRPAGLSIVLRIGVNAKMGPAVRIARSGGLVPAKPLTAAGDVEPGCDPSPTWLVEQNNGVA